MRIFITSAFALLITFGVSHAEGPYVQSIEREPGSLHRVDVYIERAWETTILARGYDKFGITGKKIEIEGVIVNRFEVPYDVTLTFYAKDVFEKVLYKCDERMELRPDEERPFKCRLQVNDSRELYETTYAVTGEELPPSPAPRP